MRILLFLKNLFIPVHERKISEISRRIRELQDYRITKASKSKYLDNSDFEVDTKKVSREIRIFEPKDLCMEVSMRSLKEKRIERERNRIEGFRNQVARNMQSVGMLLNSNEVDKAENLLIETYSTIKELNNQDLFDSYNRLERKISSLREELRYKEIERKRIEREREEEECRKKEEQERLKKEHLEIVRVRREQKAREYEETLQVENQKRILERKRLLEIVTCKKNNAEDFLNYLRIKGIKYFYHFTDEMNLVSIRKHGGLYSWYYCQNNNIRIPNAGGDQMSRALDSRHGLQDYVRLSFCSDHPMQYSLMKRGANLVLLKIKIEVAGFRDTQFSNMNAAANDVAHGPSFEDLCRVNIYAVKQTFVKREDEIFQEHQAECMVKTFIPIEYIENIDNPIRV